MVGEAGVRVGDGASAEDADGVPDEEDEAVKGSSAVEGSGMPVAGAVSAGTVTGPADSSAADESLAAITCGRAPSAGSWLPPGSAKMTATRAATATSISSTRQ